jgi:signal-transduction protein with cAMP-binding, CBS, and nucleotidyltransferase domain
MEKTDFESVDSVDSIDGDMLFEKVRKSGYESLNLEEKNLIFLDKNLSDRVRDFLERERERKIEEQIYMDFGVTKEEMAKKIEDAERTMELKRHIEAKLIENGVMVVKSGNNDPKGIKPSKKLVNNFLKIFHNKKLLTKEEITYGLKNIGYEAQLVTLNLYVRRALNWGIINIINGEYAINNNVIKELYNI